MDGRMPPPSGKPGAGAQPEPPAQPETGVFRTCVTATLSVRDWSRAMGFYKAAFGAEELYRVAPAELTFPVTH